jgi:hypothetical protein
MQQLDDLKLTSDHMKVIADTLTQLRKSQDEAQTKALAKMKPDMPQLTDAYKALLHGEWIPAEEQRVVDQDLKLDPAGQHATPRRLQDAIATIKRALTGDQIKTVREDMGLPAEEQAAPRQGGRGGGGFPGGGFPGRRGGRGWGFQGGSFAGTGVTRTAADVETPATDTNILDSANDTPAPEVVVLERGTSIEDASIRLFFLRPGVLEFLQSRLAAAGY